MASVSTSSSTEYNNSFKWTISKQTLLHILLSNQREQFVSNNFVIGKITWQLIGYPTYDTGTFSIYLRPFNIPPGWDQIIVSANLFCEETLCGDASIFTYTKHQLYRAQHWSPGCLSINEIKTLEPIKKRDQLTLSVNVQILRILAVPQFNMLTSSSPDVIYQYQSSLPDNEPSLQDQTLKWVIDDALLKEMKTCLYGKCFISTAAVNDLFCLKIFPNGYQQQGQVHMEVQWSGVPIEANNTLLEWTLSIPEADIKCDGIHRFGFDISAAHWGSKILSTEQLNEHESLTIECKISPVKDSIKISVSSSKSDSPKSTPPTLYQSRSLNVGVAALSPNKMESRARSTTTFTPSPRETSTNPNTPKAKAPEPQIDASVLNILQQFTNKMGKLYEEMSRMRQSVAQNYTYNQQCISQVTKELLVLKQRQHEMIKQIQYERRKNMEQKEAQADVVGAWIRDKVKLPQYVQLFKQNGYDDMDVLSDLTEDDLCSIGVEKIGHRKRIHKCIMRLNKERGRCSTCTSSSRKSTNRSTWSSRNSTQRSIDMYKSSVGSPPVAISPIQSVCSGWASSTSRKSTNRSGDGSIVSPKQEKINKILKLPSPGPHLMTDHELKELEEDDDMVQLMTQISEEEKLKDWLNTMVKLPQYFETLVTNGYDDLEGVADVTSDELEQIGINKMGHRKKIVKYAGLLRGDGDVTLILTPRSDRLSTPEENSRQKFLFPGTVHNIWSDDGSVVDDKL